jgi:hypothetical protein
VPQRTVITYPTPVVLCSPPPQVVFSDYEVGRVYSCHVKVRNLTQVVRSLRLLPPASQYFHMSLPRMPQDNSCIAPGMAAEVRQGPDLDGVDFTSACSHSVIHRKLTSTCT